MIFSYKNIIRASDPEGGEVTYSISGDTFSINKKTGVVTLVKTLDREQQDVLEVIISITGGWLYNAEGSILFLCLLKGGYTVKFLSLPYFLPLY